MAMVDRSSRKHEPFWGESKQLRAFRHRATGGGRKVDPGAGQQVGMTVNYLRHTTVCRMSSGGKHSHDTFPNVPGFVPGTHAFPERVSATVHGGKTLSLSPSFSVSLCHTLRSSRERPCVHIAGTDRLLHRSINRANKPQLAYSFLDSRQQLIRV
ncbi:gntP permease family protein [Anopheles sinensis]|uniref:GntP permease family protein n=1 Tax=Anopheles sinensis TaxID=74873 RepID=A0A084WMA7_ANOSI|nr:gntP permease family protein [Anopheles sinensis]